MKLQQVIRIRILGFIARLNCTIIVMLFLLFIIKLIAITFNCSLTFKRRLRRKMVHFLNVFRCLAVTTA